ncbi:MAG TPA: 50S ribosomal protein L21 [Firmicutes bacterium]|jgi:large subunit ribosomal protein L21|nr:50S ribosomal protein L21 [Bacillota bacterium]
MYAIIECGGKQYKVQEGDRVKVEKIAAEVGSTITIDKVLMLGGDKTMVGTPYVAGYKVTCKVENQDKDKKILVFHYKAKKNIRKRYGHRQPFTRLLVEKIEKVKKAAKKVAAEGTEAAEQVEA